MSVAQILLTGSSGLIGTSLVRSLERKRISTIVLRRKPIGEEKSPEVDARPLWNPYAPGRATDPRMLTGVTGAVHLAGVNVAGERWSTRYKREILESRVKPTEALALLLSEVQPRPEVLVCASAIGIYGGRGDEVLDESCLPGNGFLPDVCVAWEKATQRAADAGLRVVHLRFGVVLTPQGGALAKMIPLFRAGLGGPLGSGRQWMSWVTLQDAVRAIEFALSTPSMAGAVNVVAPHPVTNAEFTRVLGRVLHRPAVLPVPAFALRLAFGEMAKASVLESARVVPARLSESGFQFQDPDLASALQALIAGTRIAAE